MSVRRHDASTLSPRGVLIQTWAMLVDAYRDLNSKKLFWITMALSCLTVAVFAAVGFERTGFSIFGKSFKDPFINTTFLPPAQLYKDLFVEYGVGWWLGYLAIILALVSTAPMFPDFLGNGAIDLYLARPLGRARLFLTKYVVGLLFVGTQVLVFTAACILVIGLRAGVWVPGLLLAVPVVLLLFSYLWSVCALVGTITRSTIAALLVTLFAWFAISLVHWAETRLLEFSMYEQVRASELSAEVGRRDAELAALRALPASTRPGTSEASTIRLLTPVADNARERLKTADDPYDVWHRVAYVVKWPLPKTAETTKLMERWLDRQFRARRGGGGRGGERVAGESDEARQQRIFDNTRVRRLAEAEVDRVLRQRSVAWVIGTSVLFEVVVLGAATLIFVRRDF